MVTKLINVISDAKGDTDSETSEQISDAEGDTDGETSEQISDAEGDTDTDTPAEGETASYTYIMGLKGVQYVKLGCGYVILMLVFLNDLQIGFSAFTEMIKNLTVSAMFALFVCVCVISPCSATSGQQLYLYNGSKGIYGDCL